MEGRKIVKVVPRKWKSRIGEEEDELRKKQRMVGRGITNNIDRSTFSIEQPCRSP